MPTINDLRSALGPASEGRSDEELLSAYAQASGQHPNQIAMQFGYNPSGNGKWGNRTAGSIDNAQSQLYGVAEAMGLGNWARRGRVSNKFQADVEQGRAKAQGAVMGLDDIHGITDIPEYIGGLAVDSAPQMAATFGAGMAGGLPAAAAVGYGFATGDILENQREQSGKTDLMSAALLAVPYAAVDTFSGVGKLAAKGKLAKSGLRALDNMQGVGGAAARTAASVGRHSIEEGIGETFQEGMNQLGRMAVDPNAQFMSPDAQKRYLESFVGGAALGGAMGGIGGHRRSDSYRAPGETPGAPIQTWDGKTPGWGTSLGFDPRTTPDAAHPLGDLTPNWNLQDYVPGKADEGKLSFFEAPNWDLTNGFEGAKQINAKARLTYTPVDGTAVDPAGLPNNRPDPRVPRGWDGTVPEWGTAQGVTEITQQPHPGQYYSPDWQTTQGFAPQEAPGPASPLGIITPDLGLTEHAQDNYGEKLPFHQATTADEEFGLEGADKNNGNYKPVAKAPEEVGPVVPPMTELPNYGPLDVDGAKKRHAEKVVAQQQAARKAAIRKDMAEKGIPQSKQAYELYTQMYELREKGAISDKAFVDAISDLYDKSDYHNARRFVKGATEMEAAKNAAKTENAGEEGAVATRPQGQVQTQQGTVAGIDPNKVATIGRAGREQQVTPQALLQKLASATPEEKKTILAVTGLELDRDPTTGAPRLLPTREPMTMDAAAKALGVSPQAIQQRLAKFGISKEVVDRTTGEGALATPEVSGEEIGLNPEGAVDGFRIESDLSKAAGQGLVSTAEDARMTPEQRKAKADADALLKEAGPSAAVAPEVKAPEGAVVTDLREGNDARVQENIRQILEEIGEIGEMWWDGKVPYASLPDTLKVDWLEHLNDIKATYGSLESANAGAFEHAERLIEHDYAQYQANQRAAEAPRADRQGVESSARAAAEPARIAGEDAQHAAAGEDVSQGTGSYSADTGGRVAPTTTPVVTTKKKVRRYVAPAPQVDTSTQLSNREAELRAASTESPQSDTDVMLGNGRYVSQEKAVAAAQEAISAGDLRRAPFQFHNVLDIAPRDWNRMMDLTAGMEPKLSMSEDRQGSTVARVMTEISKLNLGLDPKKVRVVQSVSDLPSHIRASLEDKSPQGFVVNGKAVLIADNIRPGNARSVLMHEVGVHMGLEGILNDKEFANLANKIVEWSDRNDGSIEAVLAKKAIGRVGAARTQLHQVFSETVAYFVEEGVRAGIDPTALRYKSELGRWMAELVRLLKAGLAKLNLLNAEGLTAQDVVDMAYGAAKLEMQVDQKASATPKMSVDAQALTDTPAFKKWFGDSKVVDEEGNPQVVYHGTDADFSTFSSDAKSYTGNDGWYGKGFYLTSSPSKASGYATRVVGGVESPRAGGNVMPVFASLRNPLEINGRTFREIAKWGEWTPAERRAILAGGGVLTGHVSGARITEVAKARGYDGVIGGYGSEIVAFRPEQIKSATGNNGRFSASNPDIRFSIDDHIPEKLKPAADTVASVAKDMAKNGLKKAMFTKDLAQRAAKMLPSATKYVSMVSEAQAAKMKKEREIAQILEGYDKLPLRERGTGPASVNAFLQESTMSKAWGYKPEYHADAKVDPKMEAKFKALSPEAQALVKAVFKHGHENLLAMQKAVTDNIASEYDAVIAEAQKAGDKAGVEKAKADKAKSLRDYEGLMGQGGNWPYAPLKRFGNQVIVGVSQAYMDAVKAGDKELIRSMQNEGKHYMVEFAETRREAIARRKELEQSGQFANVQDFERDDAVQALHGRDVLSAFGRLRNLVDDSEVSAETAKALRGMMTNLHLSLLSERSALQSGRFRKNVAGADKDMMRAFATQGRATAHFIANLENSDKINETLGKMREEADDVTANDRRDRRDYYNELMRRHAMNMEYKPSPLIEKAMKVSSMWMLLTSPAHFLVNATQPYVVSLPVMAGRHGYARSAAALSKAYRELAPLLKDGKLTSEDYKHLPADVREAVNALTDRGFIDISLERELGETNTGAFDSVVGKLRKVSETVEHVNRLSTAIAALRLEREANPGAGNDAHLAYAGKIINDTHGDYSGFNAPRVMRSGVGRLMTQFRKYQLIQISMYTRLLHAAFKGATPEERMVGRKALAFSLGHMAVLGGALGMPGAQFIGAILRMVFGDDDEPDNPELTLRKMIGDETTADLLLKGVPKLAGIDLSGRLGAGGMLSLLPYADVSMDRKGYEAAVMGALGPFLGGLMPNIADGVGKIGQGKYYEGVVKMLPKGFADAYKAFHLSTEGLTQKNGDQIMSPEEVTLVDAFFQAMGLPTNTLTDRTFRANAKYELDSFYKDKMGQMKAKYVKAYREGDAQAMQDIRDNWAQLDAARKSNGYKPAGLSELLKAPAESKKREASTQGNLQYRAKDRGVVQMLDDLS